MAPTDEPPGNGRRKRDKNVEVERLVGATNRTQADVASWLTRKLGREFFHYHISRMISGARTVAHDEMDALRELAAIPPSFVPRMGPQLTNTSDEVPLYGYTVGAGEVLRLTEEAIVGVVPIHPAQRGANRNALAFIHLGDRVAPRLQHGEIAYAIRGRPPLKGHLCLVERKSGDTETLFYEGQDASSLLLYETNPKRKQIPVPIRDVAAVHAIVGITFGAG